MDVLIAGGLVIDGTGQPGIKADVGVTGEQITQIAAPDSLDPSLARTVVDATGLVVCPGFIDIQSHSLIPLLTDGRSLSKVTQGVTTEIMGELWTPAPFGGLRRSPFLEGFGEVAPHHEALARTWTRFRDWLDYLSGWGVSVNFGSYVGGATIREYGMGWSMGEASPEALAVMSRVMAEAMDDGAFGIAPALIYPPNSYSSDHELLEVARVVGRYGGTYIVHLRSEGERFLESLATTIDLGRQTGAAIEIYHLKATGRPNWSKMPAAIAMIDEARASGVDIAADMYPYVASGTGLAAALPDWCQADGRLADNLRDPLTRGRIREGILDPTARGMLAGPDGVLVVGLRLAEHAPLNGKTLAEIAALRQQEWPDTLMDLVLAEGPWASAIYFMMTEENLRLQLQQPWIKISSDAGGLDPTRPGGVLVHPRAYGTYPRVLAKYVRDEQVIGLEDAIYKMSGAVAQRLGLTNRGQVRTGAQADLVIFDPATIQDHATFTKPHQLSTGVRDVWVNGTRVLAAGVHTDTYPGQAVYGPGRRR